ncbi:MAG: nodulation protein NfeD [Gemmatimonadales bacterium]|nr:MAG: nodulation protein NfeD [Gemmatimonadales bacterium]
MIAMPTPSRRRRFTLPLALTFMVVGLLAFSGAAQEFVLGDEDGPVYRVPIQGVIEMGLAPFVERSLAEAGQAGAVAVVLDMDTPGGRVDAAERIADALQESEVPVYVWVNRRAISAGALISLAADDIFLRPSATMGAATPVDGQTGETAPEKMVSAMRSTMRSLAETRGRDPRIAEAMVDPDIEVEGVVEAGRLLTLTPSEAEELGFGHAVDTWDDLMARLGTEANPVVDMEVNWAERLVRFLSHPLVAPFLLSLGFLGLLVEIKTPSFGVAGAAGILSLSLFFGSHLLIGLAGAEGLILFGVGLVLLLLEVFLVPGLGILGILGGIGMITGVYLSMLGDLPTSQDYGRAGGVLAAAMAIVLVTSWFIMKRLPSSSRLKRLGIFLGEDTGRETGYTSSERRADLKGALGKAITDLRPSGTGLFDDERVDVVSESEWIEQGSRIRIVSSEGYRHVVRRISERADEAPGDDPDSSAPDDIRS